MILQLVLAAGLSTPPEISQNLVIPLEVMAFPLTRLREIGAGVSSLDGEIYHCVRVAIDQKTSLLSIIRPQNRRLRFPVSVSNVLDIVNVQGLLNWISSFLLLRKIKRVEVSCLAVVLENNAPPTRRQRRINGGLGGSHASTRSPTVAQPIVAARGERVRQSRADGIPHR